MMRTDWRCIKLIILSKYFHPAQGGWRVAWGGRCWPTFVLGNALVGNDGAGSRSVHPFNPSSEGRLIENCIIVIGTMQWWCIHAKGEVAQIKQRGKGVFTAAVAGIRPLLHQQAVATKFTLTINYWYLVNNSDIETK